MNLFKNIEKIYLLGFRQHSECDCGPASVFLVARAFGLRRVTFETLVSHREYGRWLNRDAGRTRGMQLTELHFVTEAELAHSFEVSLTRAYPENYHKFVQDLKRAKRSHLGIVMNFNQDLLMQRPYKNDETAFTHYSPIMDYNEKKNLVTIADVDQLIEFPYSVSVKEAFKSMSEAHHIFGYPRGWLTIRKRV